MDATIIRRRRKETAMTTMATAVAAVARLGALGLVVGALLFAALLGAALPAGAAPITTGLDGMTRESFHDSCKKSGGKPRDITQTNPETGEVDVDYSYCRFPSGGTNRCDWIKKTCTWGLTGNPPQGRDTVAAPVGDQATADDGGTGGSTVHTVTHVAPSGGLIVLADDDEQP